MAFSTEFVMGAGGAVEVEEIPVSMSGGGGSSSNPTVYPLTTVDAGDGAIILITGTMSPGTTSVSNRPHLRIGTSVHQEPSPALYGSAFGIGAHTSGNVEIAVLSRSTGTTTFTGTVYVARL